MTRPIVHIGYHKTATTWFQKRFYPWAGDYNFVPRKSAQRIFLADSALRFDPGHARALLAEHGALDRLILCEEELSGNPHTGGLRGCLSKDVAERLHRSLPDARIVIIIRNQLELVPALYQHYIREGGTHGPERYLFPERYRKDVARHPFKYPLFSFDHLDYLPLIRHYQSLFGEANVHVFVFEAFRQDPAGFMADFSQRLAIRVPDEQLVFGLENPGYGRHALRVARLLNRFSYRSVLDKRYWLNAIPNSWRSAIPRRVAGSRWAGPSMSPERLLGGETVSFVRWRYAAANRELAASLGLALGDYDYPLAD